MKLQGLIPVIECARIEPLLDFYQQAFRYIVINRTEGSDGLEWAHLKSDDTCLMLRRRTEGESVPIASNDNILLYYYTDDIQAQYRYMKAKGFDVSPLKTTAYGMQEFFLTDPAGNRLGVGQKQPDM